MTDSALVNYANIASRIVEADYGVTLEVEAIQAEKNAAIAEVEGGLLGKLTRIAEDMVGLTADDFAKHLKLPLMAAYTQAGMLEKSVASRVSTIKVAMIALCNGILPTEDQTNVNTFVNGVKDSGGKRSGGAREACRANGLLKDNGSGSGSGNKKPKAEAPKAPVAATVPEAIAWLVRQTSDKDERKDGPTLEYRCEMLADIVANWAAFEDMHAAWKEENIGHALKAA